jgi:D-alanyl-D-alanine carboxypeptidase
MMSAPFQAYKERGSPNVQFEGITIDEMIATFMKEHDIPGMTLAIVQAPYISRVTGYGLSNIQNKWLASPKTLWHIGQITSAYTAVAVIQLVEEGKITLDDPIGKFIPLLPPSWHSITLRQLIGNASGLPDYTKQSAFDPSKNYQAVEILGLIKEIPLQFQPGSKVAQSGTNFFLLGLVIENASGMSYENYIKKNQIERLGLKNTLFPSDLSKAASQDDKHKKFLEDAGHINPAEAAAGYANSNGKTDPTTPNSQGAWNAYGSLYASAEDISFWDISLAGSVLVKKKEHRDFIYHSIKLNDGTPVLANCGWRFYGHEGLMDIHGNVPGFSSYLSRFTAPSELLCVTLCANKENIDLTELARSIAGAYNRKLGPPVSSDAIRCFESSFSVQTTIDRFEEALKAKGIQIMAKIDHSLGAKNAGLTLRPTQTLIFGNPAAGTHLMLANQSIATDLPLRIAVWQEEDGSVWLGCEDINALTKNYGINNAQALVEKMSAGLSALVQHATSPY